MKAFRLLAPGRAALVDVPAPRPGPGEVVLRVLAAGVCRTDLGLLRNGAARLPVTLGHEIAGEVVAHGPGVREPAIGTPVAVYELIGCGTCAACRRGEDNLCRQAAPGVPGITRDGGMAEQVVVPARNVVELGTLTPAQAAPLTDAGMTALHAIERGRAWLGPEAVAVVVGIGGLGHLALQFIAATAEARTIAVDVDEPRLDLARRLGAAHGIRADEQAAQRILEANAGRPVDIVFDFVGSQDSLDVAARVTGRGGAIIVTGGGGGRLGLTAAMGAGRAPEREVVLLHTFGGTRGDLVKALALARDGRVQTHVELFALEDAAHALAQLEAGAVLGRAVITPAAAVAMPDSTARAPTDNVNSLQVSPSEGSQE
jgi:propanol-preferring alcohol dehydrogenase